MNEQTLRGRLAGVSQEEVDACVQHMDKFSDLAWEIAFRIVDDDLNTPSDELCGARTAVEFAWYRFEKKIHLTAWVGVAHYVDFIRVWPCDPNRFTMVRDRGTQVSLTFRKSMNAPAGPEELYGDSPYMDWGLFSSADDAMKAYKDESIWEQWRLKDDLASEDIPF